MRDYELRIKPDGSVDWVGVAIGKTHVVAINDEERLIVLKIDGYNSWVGGFEPDQYSPAQYQLHRFELVGKIDDMVVIKTPDLFGIMSWLVRGKSLQLPGQHIHIRHR